MGMRRPPLIVEFVGPSGAGKTTVAQRAIQAFAALGCRCGGRAELSGRLAWTTVRSVLALGGGRLLLDRESIRPVLKLAAWADRYRSAARSGYDLVILDQGAVQQAWSTLRQAPLDRDAVAEFVARVMRQAGARFAFVYFELSRDRAGARLAARAAARPSARLAQRDLERQQRATLETCLRYLCARAVEACRAPHAILDASGSVAQSLGQAVELIALMGRGIPRALPGRP